MLFPTSGFHCDRFNRLRGPLLALAVLWAAQPVLGQNGIFADFTTSLGNFTCQLDYTNAPKTVANFIGLAAGQRSWLDIPTGRARTNAFYDGLVFHRVIPNFMIQGGCPSGTGTSGPGYAILDEIKASTLFTNFGTLAMANSGTNSGGSQFFVTVTNRPYWLDRLHTIFGRLVSGSNVVYAISRVARDANDKPLTNVVIQSVVIRRVGTAAQAFDIHAQGLPWATNAPISVARLPQQVSLSYSNRLYSDSRLYTATNLGGSWTAEQLGIEISAPSRPSLLVTNDTARKFFRLAQVQYAGSTWAPRNLKSRTLALTLTTGGSGTINIVFGAAAGGTYTFGANSGTVNDYIWTQEPYRGRLLIALSGLPVLDLRKLDFAGPTGGQFSGTAYPNYPLPIGGFAVGGNFVIGP